jgi:non-ribosomal peptide synthetase component E (peptide arylation enzyme)
MSTSLSGPARALLRERWRREGWYRDETIAQALDRAARTSPGTPYWFHTGAGLRSSTTAEIVGQGQRLAAAFAALGIGHGGCAQAQRPKLSDKERQGPQGGAAPPAHIAAQFT